jgi:hypothetical protein
MRSPDTCTSLLSLSDVSDFHVLITSFLCCINPKINTAHNHSERTVSTVTHWRNRDKRCGCNITVVAGSTQVLSLTWARKYSGFTGYIVVYKSVKIYFILHIKFSLPVGSLIVLPQPTQPTAHTSGRIAAGSDKRYFSDKASPMSRIFLLTSDKSTNHKASVVASNSNR